MDSKARRPDVQFQCSGFRSLVLRLPSSTVPDLNRSLYIESLVRMPDHQLAQSHLELLSFGRVPRYNASLQPKPGLDDVVWPDNFSRSPSSGTGGSRSCTGEAEPLLRPAGRAPGYLSPPVWRILVAPSRLGDSLQRLLGLAYTALQSTAAALSDE